MAERGGEKEREVPRTLHLAYNGAFTIEKAVRF